MEGNISNSVKAQPDAGRIDLRRARFAAGALVVYRALKQDGLVAELCQMLGHMDSERPDLFRIIDLYSSVGYRLFAEGTGLKGYIIDKLLHTESPFSRAAEAEGEKCLTDSMAAAMANDLGQLQILASMRSEWVRDFILHLCKEDEVIQEAVMKLPLWPDDGTGMKDAIAGEVDRIKVLLQNSGSWPDCAGALAEFHKRCGSGIFSRYRAFVWKDGTFDGIESPDPVRFSDLISYELEREDVIQNTLHFLDGKPANNILLYGDRGTGKSTTVKALINEYLGRGLRMIEVPKGQLADFPLIIRQLTGRRLKFILFVDDLAFEDNEENYTALKAALEGSLESKPDNVLIYATSNRKHLIKERFSDRAGLVSGNAEDEVRAADTMQEKLSLSDRFGMTIVFSSPDKRRYLEIVEGIAEKRGLCVDKDRLQREALKWELQYNGRSPRTARQFVDWLEGQLAAYPEDNC
ncbi:MAG: ATP-binding protein [Clostridiaceae bacterium]|jgi:predicted AAA+ superfamily ATPase|nr:ATP-binding protein [Clostridiaceae bacterium]